MKKCDVISFIWRGFRTSSWAICKLVSSTFKTCNMNGCLAHNFFFSEAFKIGKNQKFCLKNRIFPTDFEKIITLKLRNEINSFCARE